MGSLELPTRLIVTNGTIEVDLIGGALVVDEWRPSSPEYVGDGIYQRWEDKIIDTITLKAASNSPDAVIGQVRKLQRLCEQALEYKTSRWQTSPVWIERQGRGESRVLYALLLNGRIPEAEGPFSQLFQSAWWRFGATWEGISLVAEHLNWAATRPLTGEDLLFNTNKIVKLIKNGSMESWVSSTDLSNWVEAGTVEQNSNLTYVYSGNYSAKITYSGGTSSIQGVLGTSITGACYLVRAKIYILSGQAQIVLFDGGANLGDKIEGKQGWNTVEVSGVGVSGISIIFTQIRARSDSVIYVDSVEAGYLTGAVVDGEVVPQASIPIANKAVTAGLTHIYTYYYSLPGFFTYSGNRISDSGDIRFGGAAAGPSPAVGDSVYFGIDTTAVNIGPFSNIAANIYKAAEDITYVWEYWDGSAWTGVLDLSADAELLNIGLNVVSWTPESDWTTGVLDTIAPGINAPTNTALWVRCVVTAVGASPVAAVADQPVYTATWNYLQTADIGGDIKSILRTYFRPKQEIAAQTEFGRLIMGAWSADRGQIQSYINISDVGNMPGITVDNVLGTFTADPAYPTGKIWEQNIAAGANGRFEISLDGVTAKSYLGEFRAFAVLAPFTAVGNMNLELITTINRVDGTSGIINLPSYVDAQLDLLVDLGTVNIDGERNTSPTVEFALYFRNYSGSTTYDMSCYAFVLIPTDEWSVDTIAADGDNSFGDYLLVDSLESQGKQRQIRSYAAYETGKKGSVYTTRASAPIQLSPRSGDQQLHAILAQADLAGLPGPIYHAEPGLIALATAEHQDRYLLNRGDDQLDKGY